MIENNIPKVFISYSWESKEHSDWVKSLADKLLADGIEAIIDSYDVSPGDRLPKFMESSIRDSDYVIIICTEEYKRKANNREKGVGYESHIISAELYNNHNDRKFIPVIRQGDFNSALPTYLDGKLAIDLRGNPFNEDSYKDLIASIFKVKKKPKVGIRPYYVDEYEGYNYVKECIEDAKESLQKEQDDITSFKKVIDNYWQEYLSKKKGYEHTNYFCTADGTFEEQIDYVLGYWKRYNELLNDGEKCEISLDNDMSNEESLEEDEELEL